jgi:hypothetical protein
VSKRSQFWLDVAALATVGLTLVSGLVLFFGFHVGPGGFRTSALGLSRLVWLNGHRFCAVGALVTAVLHASSNTRLIGARLRRTFLRAPAGKDVREVVFYLVFLVVELTGFAAWLVIGDSTPLLGPVRLGPIPEYRHHWIDLHNLNGLASCYLALRHVRARWRRLEALFGERTTR